MRIEKEQLLYDYAASLLRHKRREQLTVTEVREQSGLNSRRGVWKQVREIWKSIEQEEPRDDYIARSAGYQQARVLSDLVVNPEGLSRAALIRSAREHGLSVEDIRRVMKLKDSKAWQLAQTDELS